MNKVNLDVIKPWITKAVNDLLGFEDDVVIDYAFSQLEDSPHVPSHLYLLISCDEADASFL
jgi:hypothetical protein